MKILFKKIKEKLKCNDCSKNFDWVPIRSKDFKEKQYVTIEYFSDGNNIDFRKN